MEETYIYVKRHTFMDRALHVWKQACIYGKSPKFMEGALQLCKELTFMGTPIYLAKEPYIYGKRRNKTHLCFGHNEQLTLQYTCLWARTFCVFIFVAYVDMYIYVDVYTMQIC